MGASRATPIKTFWAFVAIYLIWGSTYLAIRIAVHDLAPFFLAAVRFVVAGLVLYGWARLQGERRPPLAVWRYAAVLGFLFFVLGNGLIVWAEQRVPSGRTALLASTSPIWTVVIESALAGWARPPGRVALGVLLGFGGLVLLANPTADLADSVSASGVAALVTAGLAWALGSVYSHRRHLDASPAMATGLKMLTGGLLLGVVSVGLGEPVVERVGLAGWDAWAALAYLVVFGSIIGFSAFTYLLRTSTPQKVATSAYVNPVVALALGWTLAGELVTGRMLLGAGVILLGVLLVRWPVRPGVVDEAEVGAMETGEWEAAAPARVVGREKG
jgi:drug/metabolite transporter (DMT)-like permease